MTRFDGMSLVLYIVGAFISFTFVVPLMNKANDIAVIAGFLGLALAFFLVYRAIVLIYQVFTESDETEGDDQ